jgi:hypothetical protein
MSNDKGEFGILLKMSFLFFRSARQCGNFEARVEAGGSKKVDVHSVTLKSQTGNTRLNTTILPMDQDFSTLFGTPS